jgi:cell division septum initiation protein DivIVA
MTLTPVEIRHLKPAKSRVGGYQRAAVDGLMDEIVTSFEDVWRERADLADKVEQLETDLVRSCAPRLSRPRRLPSPSRSRPGERRS